MAGRDHLPSGGALAGDERSTLKPDVIERNAVTQNRYREINEHLAKAAAIARAADPRRLGGRRNRLVF